jgi:hypothetical protein
MLLFSAKNKQQIERASLANLNKQRGDFPWPAAIGAWLVAAIGYIILDHKILPAFPVAIVAFYALVWTPINSYISARMTGLTGQSVQFPFLNQGIVLKSGYTRPDIWFAPMPLNDYGSQAQRFREFELTGTKFTSIVKLELFMLPLVLVFSFIYWSFIDGRAVLAVPVRAELLAALRRAARHLGADQCPRRGDLGASCRPARVHRDRRRGRALALRPVLRDEATDLVLLWVRRRHDQPAA